MKITLIYPSSSKKIPGYIPKIFYAVIGKYPPLGLAYLASCLEKAGYDVQIIDAEAMNLTNEEIIKKIKSYSPDLVGYYSTTSVFKMIKELNKEIQNAFKVASVIGGPQVNIFPKKNLGIY